MGVLSVATIFCLCLSSSFATYGQDYKPHGHNKHNYDAHNKHNYDAHKSHKVSEARIHLDSPKIILERPSINVHDPAPLHEDEPIILGHDKPLYIRKSLHGIPSGSVINAAHAHPAPVPVLLDGGYSHSKVLDGGYSHGKVLDGGYTHGKVLDITAPIQVINHAPIVQERPILIRRPVVVSKSLSGTQDHLERLHYAHSGIIHSGGYSHGQFAVPVSKALHERTLVYGAHDQGYGGLAHGYGGLAHGYGGLAHGYGGLTHGYGGLAHGYGGHIAPAVYSAPVLVHQPRAVLLEQPKAHGHSHGGFVPSTHFHAHGGHLHAGQEKKY